MNRFAPRWQKLLGDVRVARGRFIGIAVAMAITIALVAAILSARAILDREMNRNYLSTVPPSAILSLDVVDDALLEQVRQQPGILLAERTASIAAKTQLPSGDPIMLFLRVVPDFSTLRIAKFYPQSGAWPPAKGEVLIERAVDRMMPIKVGAKLAVEMPSGERQTLRIAGTAHDPGNAPAWQERLVYGYISADTAAQLDPSHTLDQLQVVSEARTTRDIEKAMRELAVWLRAGGHPVHFIRIPPPGQHPHQWQIDAMSLTLFGFGLLAIALEAALLAIVIGGVLAPQVRQIAVMKAVGARTHQIVGMYLTLVLLLTLGALIVGLPIGVFAGKWLASYVVDLLNFNIESGSVPNSVLGTCILLGLAAPLLAALWPIVAAARKSVRESIDYYGVSSNAGNRWLTRLCNRIRFKNVSAQLALRNLSRRKAQLLLAMSLLVLTGAVFMLSGNLLGLWREVTSASIAEQLSDVQVSLRSPELEATVNETIMSVAGVRIVEPARVQWANVDDGDGFSFSTRSLPLSAVVAGSELLKLDVQAGRWLVAEDENSVVLNSAAATNVFAHAKVGDEISLLVNRKPLRLLVVGIARDMFNSAAAYTTQGAFAKVVDSKGLVRNVRVGLQAGVDASATANAIEQALAARNLPARGAFTKAESSASITAHTYIFISMMLLIVVSVAKIAVAGLASCMSTAVIERTREFGVMRTLGARAHDIQNSIILEAVMIGLMSWIIALLLAIPLTMWIGRLLSATVNRQLPLVVSPLVAGLWLVGVVLVATIASVAPAKRAAGLTIRQTLTQI